MPSTLNPTSRIQNPVSSGGPHASGQRKLVLDDLPRCVLATVETARLQLPGHDEDDILALVDEGYLPWSWNIALDPKSMSRELRIFPDCVLHYKTTVGKQPFPITGLDQLVRQHLLRGHDKPFLPSTLVKLILNCGATHVTNLIDAKQFSCLPLGGGGRAPALYRRGPNGAALITRQSFVKFLETRLEGSL